MSCHLYRLTFANGKQYIGKTNDLTERKSGHRYDAQKSERLVARAWRKYGQPVFEHLATVEDCMINDLEINAIVAYHTFMPNGYNMTIGGEGVAGYLHTSSAKLKISHASSARWGNPAYVQKVTKKMASAMTPEAKEQRSLTLKAQRRSPEYRQLMSQRSSLGQSSPEYRKLRSELAKQQWADPEKRAALLANRVKGACHA